MRYLLFALLVLGCRREREEVRPDDKRSAPERVKCSIPEGDTLSGAVKVPARCDLVIHKLLHVPTEASLDVGAGAKLTFAKGAGLLVEGGTLTARGTAAEPIVFTSAESKPAPGDWSGIFIAFPKVFTASDAKPPPASSILEHVVVEFGGGYTPSLGPAAGISVRPAFENTAQLSHVKIRKSAGVGLYVHRDEAVTKLEAISFDSNRGAVDVPIATFAQLGGDPGDVVRLHGALKASATLPKLARPYVVEEGISATATKGTPMTLTIADDTIVRFAKGTDLSMSGFGARATFVAHKVTFTSAADAPAVGDWRGLHFSGDVAADVDSIVVEYTGGSSKKSPVLTLPSDDKKVKVVNSTFRNNGGAAFQSWSSCAPWEDPALKNTSVGQPLCEDIMPKLSMKLLGSLSGSGTIGVLGSMKSDTVFGDLDGVAAAGPGAGGLGAIGGGGGGAIYVPPKSSVVTESSITASGGLPADVVRKIVRGRTSSLRSCHGGSSATGSITVTFTIDAKGAVTSASASSFGDESVRSCVASVFKGMTFPEAESTTSASATHSYAP